MELEMCYPDSWISGYMDNQAFLASPDTKKVEYPILANYQKCWHILVNFVDFSSIQKYPDTWIPMDKLSIIQVSMISNYP